MYVLYWMEHQVFAYYNDKFEEITSGAVPVMAPSDVEVYKKCNHLTGCARGAVLCVTPGRLAGVVIRNASESRLIIKRGSCGPRPAMI